MEEKLLEVKNLKKYFETPKGALHAVDDVSFTLGEKKTLGVVGESGCGKSTLGRTILGLTNATAGQVIYRGEDVTAAKGRDRRIMRRKMQIIFQDPSSSLDPRMSVRDLIAEPLRVNRVYRRKADMYKRVRELMDIVGLAERFEQSYSHELDGGRRQRIGVARVLATVLSQLESMLLSAVILYRHRKSLGLRFGREMLRRDAKITALMLKQAIPLSIKSVALSGSNLFVSAWINSYGVQAVAAVTVGRKATMFNSITSQGLMNAGTSMIGQNIGARKFDRVQKIVTINGLISLCTFFLYSAVYILFIDDLFGLFTTDPAVLAYAHVFLPAMILGLLSNSIMIPFFTLVMGSGFARFNLAVSVLDGIVLRVGLSLLLGAVCGYGVKGFFLGDNLAALGTALPSAAFYFSGVWRRRVLIEPDGEMER